MSIIKTFIKPDKDERLEAKENRIYKIGFYILSVGILFDFLYSIIVSQVILVETGSTVFEIRPLELASLLIACLVCIILQTREGFTTSNKKFADVDTFPQGYYLPIAAASGIGAWIIWGVLRSIAEYQVVGFENIHWFVNFGLGVFLGVTVFAGCYLVFWGTWRSAKKRSDRHLADLENE